MKGKENAGESAPKTEGPVPSVSGKAEAERVVSDLNERLDIHDENRKEVQEHIHSM